jgi:hypothetical protein
MEEEAMSKDITKAEADDIKSKSKGIILAQMLLTSIESLKDQGIKYVEFSYSNHNTLKVMLSVLEATEIEGITVKFLLSENRTAKPKLHRRNSREVKALMEEYPEVVGFDLMGLEQEIMPSEYENTGECKTLYDRLRFTVEQLLDSSREKPTLRLHSGEIYYNREGSPNNNPQFILEILKQIEEDLGVSLADKLNIRIGHGLHFQSTPAYFDLLKHFDVIVEICASSNFALGNVMDLKDMPYKEYEEHGIPFVIGTDGGGFYLTTLKDEAKIAGVFGGDDIIARLKKPPKGVKTTPSTEPTIERDDIPTIKELYEGFLHKNATSYFVKEYNKASNKKKYIKQYFKSEYTLDIEEKNLFPQDIGEYEKVKMEFTRLQAFYHDKVINEVYFSKEQEIIILSTFDKIEEDIKKHKILDAASSIFALQESIKCESRIEKIALYIYSQGKDLTDYLAMPKRAKQVQKYDYSGEKLNKYDDFFIEYEKPKSSESFHDINYYVDDILRKKSEIRDKMLENPDEFYKDYFKEGQYHLDIPERGYFNIDESEPSKLLNEMLRTVKFCDSKLKSEAYNETQEAIISDTFNNINRLLEERNYLEAASYLVSLQTVLGMKVKLETAYVYMSYNHKEIEDYINIELFQENTKGRGKTK